MSVLAYLVALALFGLLIGALARLALPGRDPMTVLQTTVLGLAGNFIAGVIVLVVWGHGVPALVLSVGCSALILYGIRRSRGGGLSRPSGPPPS
jgi:uncharacterized membrane protein YeaQ/YmgE (transglycosylase-associated protein family)